MVSSVRYSMLEAETHATKVNQESGPKPVGPGSLKDAILSLLGHSTQSLLSSNTKAKSDARTKDWLEMCRNKGKDSQFQLRWRGDVKRTPCLYRSAYLETLMWWVCWTSILPVNRSGELPTYWAVLNCWKGVSTSGLMAMAPK